MSKEIPENNQNKKTSETVNTHADVQYNKMVNTPVSSLIAKLAVPTVISMMITALYNMADTFFVSQINTQASAAVGIVFPIMAIIQAFGFTLGMGSGSLISIRLGQKKNEEANIIASTAFVSALFLGACVTATGLIFSKKILSLIGASESILPYAKDYAQYIFWGAPFICASFVFNNDLRAEGKAFLSMIALTSGGILNIILDPVFIYGLKLGISGAAIATVISQIISFSILFSFYLRKKTIIKINPKLFSPSKNILGKILTTGFPSLARQGMASLASILLNTAAGAYGDSAIAAMTIASKILMLCGSLLIGIGQGFAPVSGYNYGAKRNDRVKKAFIFMISSTTCILSVLSLLIFIFARSILTAFIKDEEAIRIGIVALRWQVAFMPFHSIIIGTNMLMQSTRHVKAAGYLSMNRQGIYFIPAILILPKLLGLTGVEISQFVADVLSAISAIPFILWLFKRMDSVDSTSNSTMTQQ